MNGQVAESYQRIILRPPANHYRLAGWDLFPYLAKPEVQDGCAPVYFRPGLLLNECAGGCSPAADGQRDPIIWPFV